MIVIANLIMKKGGKISENKESALMSPVAYYNGSINKGIPKIVSFGKRETAGGVKLVHTSTKNMLLKWILIMNRSVTRKS